MEPANNKKEQTPEQIAAGREAKKLAALEAKAAKIAKATAKSEQAQKWKDVQKKNQEDPAEAKAAKDRKKEEQKKKSGKPEKEKVVYVETPKGQKKILPGNMAPTYDVKSVENSWYDWWVESNFFTPEYIRPGMTQEQHDDLEKFVMVIPPPNVTGVLHIGHALTSSIQDTIIRFHRMHRKRVLWVPGMDHAGIATQAVVEKKLYREGITKADLGREKFLEKVWEWKNEHGNHITSQLRRMGVSVDWNREVFTMDKNLSVAVNEAFIRFYEKGIIYRANRLVNWSCKLRTCISDIECDDWEINDSTGREFHVAGHDKDKTYPFGYLWSFAYQVDEENSKEEIVISTTRPETMLGDTAIAIHPDDERYAHFRGREIFFKHPFLTRRIPLIYDSDLVKMEFGTGAVKVTPAHDPNDYECGTRKKLEFITILNEDGSLNSECGEFSNMMRYDVRVALVKRLEEKGLFRGRQTHDLCIKKCSRSGDIVEPILKPQWWANMTDLAKRTMDLFHEKAFTITPNSPHHQIWFSYMENIRPWCISRQLWWGHRVPAYLVWKKGQPKPQDTTSTDNWVIATSDDQAIEKAKAKLGCDEVEFEQDSDVLDTWFSSGLFPFSVMGWPNTDAEDFKKYYPTNFLETGYDILFFWVARMVMMGLELTGKLPFTDVFLHTLVRDAKGIKMTKSLGNVIDPICVIEGISLQGLHDSISGGNLAPEQLAKAYQLQKEYFPEGIKECGTDALRFTLLTYMGNKSINLDTKRIEGYRHFCNKIWNAMILSRMFFGPGYVPQESNKLTGFESPSDLWILSRLHATILTLEESFKELDFGKFSNALYLFWIYDVCDVYLEVCKPILFYKGEITAEITQQQLGTRATVYTVLDSSLKALHPIMPFITEELWQYLPRRPQDLTPSICVSDYPLASEIYFAENSIPEFDFIQLIIKAARNLCLAQNIIKRGVTKAIINTHTEKAKASVEKYRGVIITLAYLRPDLDIFFEEKSLPEGAVFTQVDETCDLYLIPNAGPEKK